MVKPKTNIKLKLNIKGGDKVNNFYEENLSPEEIKTFQSMAFSTDLYMDGVYKDVDTSLLHKWMNSPDVYRDKLARYVMYLYLYNGDVRQMLDLYVNLSDLEYEIKSLKTNKKDETYAMTIRKTMKSLNHKRLTRDILMQLATVGTVVGLWVGKDTAKSKEQPYLMLFDDLDYFYPYRRRAGKWTVACDLSYFDTITDLEDRFLYLESLSPYITVEDYNLYKTKGEAYKIKELPLERSICLRVGVNKRNQRFGTSIVLPAIDDIKHKEKLRNLEKVASNKVIQSIATLTLGIEGSDTSTYKKLGEKLTKSVFENVKKGLQNNTEGDSCLVGLPEWAKLEYPTIKTDVLDPEKMTSINADISNAIGISRTLTNGDGGNYAGANLNLDIIYKKIGVILEDIENEVYQKMVQLILPPSVKDDYYLEYNKNAPLTNKERADIYYKLVSLGYSLKPLIELIGKDFNEYIDNSIYEIEELNLREVITPPLSSYTATSSGEEGGRPEIAGETSESTITTKNNDSNSNPTTAD